MVRIFIEFIFKGSFKKCDGSYAIVLETEIESATYRKVHCATLTDTTPQRLQLRSVIEALGHMKEPSMIEIHINSPYLVSMYRNPEHAKKNILLWQQYKELSKGHDIEIVSEKINEYSRAMKTELSTRKFVVYRDERIGE